jgi:DNA polymerase-1
MQHILFQENEENIYKIAILIKSTALNKIFLEKHYVTPMVNKGILRNDIIAFNLAYNDNNKAPVKLIKEHLNNILKATKTLQITTLLVADSDYFKVLTKERKAEPHHGYIKQCKIAGYEHLNIILIPNYQALFHNPTIQERIDMGLFTINNHINGSHMDIGTNIIKYEYYPESIESIQETLNSLHQYPELTCDIEAFSLLFHKAGIGTISFAWDKHHGIAFTVDWVKETNSLLLLQGFYGKQVHNPEVKALLLNFFLTYKGNLKYHNAGYDVKVLIYELFMSNLLDREGLLNGIDVMCKNIDDTKLITYLATNSTSGNNLKLKHNAFEFAGNYAQEDIHDIRLISKTELLRYNLIDGLSTWFVFLKNYPIMLRDKQLQIYEEIMLPSIKVIAHMELIGMPIDMEQVYKTKKELETIVNIPKEFLRHSPLIKTFEWNTARLTMIERNAELKKKVKPIDDFKMVFNPASPKQLQILLYNQFGLPITDYTDTKQPATGKDTLKKLRNHLISLHEITEEELT